MIWVGTLIIAVCSVGIIIMFCIMSFLLTTIEPPKITPIASDAAAAAKSGMSMSESDARKRAEGMFFDDTGLPIVDTVQYGLEKADGGSDVIDFYRSTKKPVLNYQNKDRKVIPPLWPRVTHEIIVNPTMHKVMPPIWPTTSVIIDTAISNSIKIEHPKNNKHKAETRSQNKSHLKPVKRRSVSNYILDEDTGSVILKILDYNGQPRIEIKLWPDQQSQKMNEKSKALKKLKNLSEYIWKSDNDFQHLNNDEPKNTVVTIMANDSIVVEESESSNITELFKSMVSISTKEKRDMSYNISDQSSKSLDENLFFENTTSTISFVNKTFFLCDMGNSNNTELANNSSTDITKHAILFNTMKNNSNIVMNITEFDKRIFDEEVNHSKASTNNINPQENEKISISDIYPTNFTDLFIENDSDMVY